MYCAGGDLAGVNIPVQSQGTATAGSPQTFNLPPGAWTIQDITGPATGRIRLWCNGQPGPTAVDLAALIAMRAAGNTYGAFAGGNQFGYSLVVDSALAA
jgi:hypothetical protein